MRKAMWMATGYDCDLPAPFGLAAHLSAFSNALKLADSTRKASAAGSVGADVNVAAGTASLAAIHFIGIGAAAAGGH